MASDKDIQNYKKELRMLILKEGTSDANLHNLLEDLLTPAEYKDLAVRLQIVKLLSQGNTFQGIAEKLKVGVSTVARGARELFNKNGLFSKLFLKK